MRTEWGGGRGGGGGGGGGEVGCDVRGGVGAGGHRGGWPEGRAAGPVVRGAGLVAADVPAPQARRWPRPVVPVGGGWVVGREQSEQADKDGDGRVRVRVGHVARVAPHGGHAAG